MHSTIDENHTCTFCQNQEQNRCTCRLQPGVKTAHLSDELSNRNDLGYGLLTKKDFSSEAEIISDGYLDCQKTMENNVTRVGKSDYSCLPCDSNLTLNKSQQMDYCDVCDSNICKHTCNARDTNDKNCDLESQLIIKLTIGPTTEDAYRIVIQLIMK